MTPDQVKAFMTSVLQTLSEEFETDARNEDDLSTSRTLYAVSHRVGSVVDDLDYHMREVMGGDNG